MGGSARTWIGELPTAAHGRALVRLRLVLTKFGDPRVQIRWTVRVDANPLASR